MRIISTVQYLRGGGGRMPSTHLICIQNKLCTKDAPLTHSMIVTAEDTRHEELNAIAAYSLAGRRARYAHRKSPQRSPDPKRVAPFSLTRFCASAITRYGMAHSFGATADYSPSGGRTLRSTDVCDKRRIVTPQRRQEAPL